MTPKKASRIAPARGMASTGTISPNPTVKNTTPEKYQASARPPIVGMSPSPHQISPKPQTWSSAHTNNSSMSRSGPKTASIRSRQVDSSGSRRATDRIATNVERPIRRDGHQRA